MMGGNGIVGSHIPVATGVAFAQKYKNEKKVTLGFYGDGEKSTALPAARCRG